VSHRYNQVYKVWQNRSADANATYTITVAELNNATASKLGGPKFFNKLVLLSIRDADSTKANIAVAADGLSLTVSPVPSKKGHIRNVIPVVFEGVANGTLPARGGKHQPVVPPAGPFNATGLIELLLCECLAMMLSSAVQHCDRHKSISIVLLGSMLQQVKYNDSSQLDVAVVGQPMAVAQS
jgi:hypothetical protein